MNVTFLRRMRIAQTAGRRRGGGTMNLVGLMWAAVAWLVVLSVPAGMMALAVAVVP
jgi:hypothetical protein